MVSRRKRRKARRVKKVSIFWPFFIVILGLILFAGSFWIYKRFSTGEKIQRPKIEVGEKTTREVTLYFANLQAKKLVAEKREIFIQPNKVKEIRELVEELIRGPRNKDLARTLPPQAKLRSLYIDFNEAIAYVDFSGNIAKYFPGGSSGEILLIYSISNSIIDNFPEVKLVKILINGEEAQTLAGHIDLTRPLTFSEGIVKGR